MNYDKKEIMQYMQEEDVKFIRLAFCDVFGKRKNISIMTDELLRAFNYGIAFDASAISGFGDETHSDLFLHPDPSTLTALPWRPEHGRVVQMISSVKYPDNTPFECDTRRLLINAIAEADKKTIYDYYKCVCFGLILDWLNKGMTDEYAATGFMDKASELLMKLPKDKKYSLIYTNVRGFRAINDIFGEQSGDIAIFQIRDAIRKYLNPIILGRLEADHYVLIAEDDKITDEAMTRLSHRMFTKGSKDYHFDLCMGIVPIEDRTESIRLLIDRAVLVEKKISGNGGRTFARYDSNLQINYIMDRMLSSDMDISLENGEFKVYYQPVVNAKSKKIVSAEALIRWQHHNLGMVGPGRFIPLFEETGQISAIDRFIASHVLEFNKKRDITGRKIVPCAVNLSRIDFYDSRLLYDILAYIYNDKNTERYIKFEVTESAYAVMESSALEFLNALHSKNIQILLDDFGSGMSSLSTLESFNFNIVKLDMGFIRKINISKKAEAIIKSTIRMSHSLGSKVVAEGVEDESQYQFLKDAGCDMIQGYYFYKPMPEEEFVKLLNEQQKR